VNKRTRTDILLVTLLSTLSGACTPEVTAPQAGAAISRVVPIAVPDVWCSASSDAGQDSTAAKDKKRPRPACEAPKQVDSTSTAWDTTKQHAK
jgi:hypothetical protein